MSHTDIGTDIARGVLGVDRPEPRRARTRFDWGQPFVYLIALLTVGLTLAPVLYLVIGGFRTTGQLTADPNAWPDPWVLANYERVLASPTFWQQIANSGVTALATTAGVVLLGVMAAFVLARYNFKARDALYLLFTVGLLFPITVAIVPLYLMLQNLGLLGSLAGIIIPQVAFALPVTIVILVPFLRAIPAELEDAASIDGTSRIGFFLRILLPLSGPGLVTVGVLAFVGSWNAYLLPLLVLSDPTSFTLPLGVQAFSTQYSQDTAMVLAFTSLAMLPALIFFTLAERRIVGGLTGAVKG
jgi:raffinose/stachyose/melibiose transport system permease protein